MGDFDDLSPEERDDQVSLELGALIADYLRSHGLRGAIGWDGSELTVSWRAGQGDE